MAGNGEVSSAGKVDAAAHPCGQTTFTADAAFDVVPDWMMLIDAEHTIRRANRAMAEALGVEPCDLVGRRCYEVVHGSDEPIDSCPHRDFAGARPAQVTVARVDVPLCGAWDLTCAPLADQDDGFAGSVHILRSVDDDRRPGAGPTAPAAETKDPVAEPATLADAGADEIRAALEAREALLHGIFATMTAGCAIYEVRGDGRSDADYIIKDMNPAALHSEGVSLAEAIGTSLRDLSPTAAKLGLVDAFWRVAHTGRPERFPATRWDNGSSVSWYRGDILRLPSGEIVELYDDVTAERRKEEALCRKEAEIDALFDLVGVPILVMDTRGAVLRWNRAAHRALGYEFEDAAKLTLRDLTPPEDRVAMLRRLAQMLGEGGSGYRLERRMLTGDGRTPWFDVSLTPVLGEDGKPLAIIAAGTDVTERKRAQADHQAIELQLRDALSDTVEAMGALVALRDPYTAGHERRVTQLVEAIAVDMGLPREAVVGLRHAASVHDVGKIAVPAEILSRPARLSEWEFSLVQTHPTVGHDVLSGITFERPVADFVLQHHERLDGSGYPQGLSGDAICLEARIIAVADVVEAMASHRPYRPALGVEAALDEIRDGADVRYDASVVTACERVLAAGAVDLSRPSI